MDKTDICEQSNIFFDLLEKNKSKSDEFEKLFIKLIDSFLTNPNLELINVIFDLFEKNRQDPAFFIKSTLVRLDRIFLIIKEEINLGMIGLFTECSNSTELIEKYILTTFAIHRLETSINNDFVNEALEFIMYKNISICAINKICDEEMIIYKNKVFKTIADKYKEIGEDKAYEEFIAYIKEN